MCLRSCSLRGHSKIFAKTKDFVLMQIVIFLTEFFKHLPAQLKQGVDNKATVTGLKFDGKK